MLIGKPADGRIAMKMAVVTACDYGEWLFAPTVSRGTLTVSSSTSTSVTQFIKVTD